MGSLSSIGGELGGGNVWFDYKAGGVERDLYLLTGFETEIAGAGLVVAIGVGEGFGLPVDRLHPFRDGSQQHVGVFQAWEVDVAGKIFRQFFDRDMVATPEGDTIHLTAQEGSGVLRNQHILASEPTTRVRCQRTLRLGLHLDFLQLVGAAGIGLVGDEEPDVGFGDERLHALFRIIAFGLRLILLEVIQIDVEYLVIAANGLPGEEAAHTLFEVFQAIAVGGEEDKGIAILAVRVATMVEHIFRGCPRLALCVAYSMGELRFEDD